MLKKNLFSSSRNFLLIIVCPIVVSASDVTLKFQLLKTTTLLPINFSDTTSVPTYVTGTCTVIFVLLSKHMYNI